MITDASFVSRARYTLRAVLHIVLAGAILSLMGVGSAAAYVGPSFMHIQNATGDWQGAQYKGWFHVNSHYWSVAPLNPRGLNRSPASFPGPLAPRQGPSSLVVAIDKKSPALPQLMERCLNKTPIPEITYAESSDLARSIYEIGARPTQIPEYYEYRLTNVRFSDCPVVPGAPDQAIVISFDSIDWLNYQLKEDVLDPRFDPVALNPAAPTKRTRSFVVTWFGVAHDVSDDQCPVLAAPPPQDDYYAFLSKEDADEKRAQLAPKGGASYINGQMGLRGPHMLNVCKLPGILPDPGHPAPQTTLARGLNLDGDDGNGHPPAGTCRHKNYVSADGRTGIDNQLFTVMGCIPALQGHKGWTQQFTNNQMRDGAFSMLLQLTGIDDPRNDDSVEVTLFYSLDPMAKSAAGTKVLSDYTFRVTDDPHYTHYFRRFHGRIVNGVLITDSVKEFRVNLGKYGTPAERRFLNARMRLELLPDGSLRGVLGAYQDLWWIANQFGSSAGEQQQGYQCPGVYNALRRAADGMKDPVTGECNAISVAYDIEAIPAFIATMSRPKLAKAETVRHEAQAKDNAQSAR